MAVRVPLSAMFARGGESDYNLVLIDGVRMNQAGGQFDFSRIAASEIERVEVVRGAQSALWGSDAMGSVVQVFTRTGGDRCAAGVRLDRRLARFNSWRGDCRRRRDARGTSTIRRASPTGATDGAFQDLLPQDDWFEQSAFDGGLGVMLGHARQPATGLRVSRAQGRSVGNITFGSRDTGGEYDTEDVSWHTELTHTVGTRFLARARLQLLPRTARCLQDDVDDPPFATYAILSRHPGRDVSGRYAAGSSDR